MEEFLNIDWHPPLEDLIDNVFINEERMKRESVMYRIMQGSFVDPFTEFETDDSEETEEEEHRPKKTRQTRRNEISNKDIKGAINVEPITQRTHYVPGIVKPTFHFPRLSNLSKEEQATCLRVLLRFSGSEKPEMNSTNRNELELYMKLSPMIREEQEEFLELAKTNWNGTKLNIVGEEYINERWKFKVEETKKLPRYYVAAGNIPFNGEEKINITAEATLLELGRIPRVIIPSLPNKKRIKINCILNKLELLYPTSKDSTYYNNKTVSQDPNCERLTESGDIDLVISSGGLNCLANNFGPNYTRSWILPVVVKENETRNIVYVDKPLPPTALNVSQKNAWIYKYILKSHLLHPHHHTSIRLSEHEKEAIAEDELFGSTNSDRLLELEEEHDLTQGFIKKRKIFQGSIPLQNQSTIIDVNNSRDKNAFELKASSQELSSITVDKDESLCKIENNSEPQNLNDDKDEMNEEILNDQISAIEESGVSSNCPSLTSNVMYKSFSLGPATDGHDNSTKTKLENYKILVRTRTDAIERINKTMINPVMLIPKLEHQVALGAEAVTAEEALKQWTILTYRPNTSLVRVRISMENSEVIQIERRTPISINNEIKRLYNLNVEDSLITLHNVVCHLKPLKPGNYLLRHTPTNGAFATIYQQADTSGKNVFDLHGTYAQNSFQTIPKTPWPVLDKAVITPSHICFKRMPAMYHPPRTDGDAASKISRGRGRGRPRGSTRGHGRVPTQDSVRGSTRGGLRGGTRVRTKKAKKNKGKKKEEEQS